LKKAPKTISRVGLIANPDKPNCQAAVRAAAELVRSSGRSAWTEPQTAQLARLKLATLPEVRTLARETDLLLVFGGDGTMLRVAREVAGLGTPMLGINVGGLGFLTAVPLPRLAQALRQIWSGDFTLESRPLIEASGQAQSQSLHQSALNDFVVSRGVTSRMIHLEVHVNRQELTIYRCDGLIISSPTGSTAYCLSAGGSIVSPDAEVFSITPICPHTLNNRSVIVSLYDTVTVKVLSERLDTVLTADGQLQTPLTANDCISFRRSRRAIRLVRLPGNSFFQTLRQKLNWSGSNLAHPIHR